MPEILTSDPRNKQEPSSFDYETKDFCDTCQGVDAHEPKLGTMFHARGATGRICEVLFLCTEHAEAIQRHQ